MRAIFCAGAAIVAALVASPASAADINTPYAAVEVAPARMELAVPDMQPVHRTFVIANLSTSAETVDVAMSDFTVSRDGAYQFLPQGATPWSIALGLSLSSTHLLLQPQAQAKVELTYVPLTQTSLRAGALIFTPALVTSSAAPVGTGAVVKLQAVVPVLAVPAGSDGTLDTSVTLTAKSAGMNLPSAWGWPQLSFQESGPITATATFRNSGNAIGRFDTWFTWSNLGRDFLQTEAPPGVALPGTTSTAGGSTKVTLPGQGTVDTTPMFGIIQVHASSSLVLLGQRSPETSQDRYVVIAPWRALGLILAVLGGAFWAVSRRRQRR